MRNGPDVVRALEFTSEVVEIEPVMGDSVLLTTRAPASIVNNLRAGRFFELLCRASVSYDPLLRRPYSVYRTDAAESTLTFLVRPFGRGGSWLAERALGDDIGILGPLGNAYEILPRSRRLLMVAGGVGVAPLVFLSDEAVQLGLDVTFLMGAANGDGLLPASQLASAVEYVVATDDGSQGHHGAITDLAPDYVRWSDQIFTCGPEPMYQSLRALVGPERVGGRPSVQVSMERSMACGFGACLGCVVETRRGMVASCVDGPVYDMDDVVWG